MHNVYRYNLGLYTYIQYVVFMLIVNGQLATVIYTIK